MLQTDAQRWIDTQARRIKRQNRWIDVVTYRFCMCVDVAVIVRPVGNKIAMTLPSMEDYSWEI